MKGDFFCEIIKQHKESLLLGIIRLNRSRKYSAMYHGLTVPLKAWEAENAKLKSDLEDHNEKVVGLRYICKKKN